MKNDPSITVVVPAHNEAELLPTVLDSLAAQTLPKTLYSVIVVDNNSTDNTWEVVREYESRLQVRYIFEPQLGVSHAMNTGYRTAETDYVAFIDADAKAAPDWLEQIMAALERVHPHFLGGPYFAFYNSPKPAWARDCYFSRIVEVGEQARLVTEEKFVLNATNMICQKRTLEYLGGFTPLGLKGRGMARGDETELMIRAWREIPDLQVYYDPAIVVYHLVRSKALSIRYWLRWAFNTGRRGSEVWHEPPRGFINSVVGVGWHGSNILLKATIGGLIRDRKQFPFMQNYWFERIVSHFYKLG
ncbi:MAG: glycosyltransferase, partial [Chloroflexota bacterium]